MKKQIIILNGTGGSGKDTFINLCSKYASCMSISSVDKVYEAASLMGWPRTKTDKDRKLLAAINRALEEYDDIPFKDCCALINDFLLSFQNRYEPMTDTYEKNDTDFIFLDVRSPEIIDRFKERYNNVYTVLVDNGKLTDSTPEDLNVNNYDYDYTINNKGTLCDLEQQAHDFVTYILNQEDTRRKR